MQIGFKPQFIPAIASGKKIHTIRRDVEGKAQPGELLYMYDADQIINNGLHGFDIIPCTSVQKFEISICKYLGLKGVMVFIDNKKLKSLEIHELAINDGFDNVDQFFDWFNTDYVGKIIHWTDKKY